MKMLIAFISSVMRACFSFVRRLISLPGRLAGALLGEAALPPPAEDSPLVTDLEEELAQAKEQESNWKKVADAIWSWAAESLSVNQPAAIPIGLPRSLKQWMVGLTAEEVEALLSADKVAIEAHARGLYTLPGLRRVQRLDPIESWSPRPELMDPASEPFQEAICAPPLRRAS
ncbi:hypothetical protein [Bradyrhizobium arachidis]|uniref:hypothetical protein n=1 Tax=Bradyrhizobium arachidis TaxID=858423 RepID=UPI002163E152|nr:hypothetical protein [Bradyrhizobium arachidis]UVO31452.1 hypothetical protein KUF59_12765 [Bradyrhizobium arachidis]